MNVYATIAGLQSVERAYLPAISAAPTMSGFMSTQATTSELLAENARPLTRPHSTAIPMRAAAATVLARLVPENVSASAAVRLAPVSMTAFASPARPRITNMVTGVLEATTAWRRCCPSIKVPWQSNLIASPVICQRPDAMSRAYALTTARLTLRLLWFLLSQRSAVSGVTRVTELVTFSVAGVFSTMVISCSLVDLAVEGVEGCGCGCDVVAEAGGNVVSVAVESV